MLFSYVFCIILCGPQPSQFVVSGPEDEIKRTQMGQFWTGNLDWKGPKLLSRRTFDGCSWSSFCVDFSWLQTTNVNPPWMPCSDTCPGLIELEVRTLGSTRSYTFGRKRLETGRCSRPFAAAIISLTLNLADLCCRDWQYLHDNLFKRYNRALNPYLYWYLRS